MKTINEYIIESSFINIYENKTKEEILKEISDLKQENDKLGEEDDELFGNYDSEDEFFELASPSELSRNVEIWNKIESNDKKIALLYKELQKFK